MVKTKDLPAVETRGRGRFRRRAGLAGPKLYAVIAVAIVAILAVPAFVVYQGSSQGTGTSTSTSSSSALAPAQQQVSSRVQQYAKDIGSLNVTGIDSLYTSSAVLTWSGKGINASAPFNKAGTYGIGNISALYSTLFNDLVPAGGVVHPIAPSQVLTIAYVSSLSTNPVSINVVNSSFTLYLNFTSGLFGDVGATIHVQQQWTSQSGTSAGPAGWFLSKDSWEFMTSYIQYPVH